MAQTMNRDELLAALQAPFDPKHLDWRVGRAGVSGSGENKRPWALVLSFVDARAVQNRLDEVAGPDGWQVEYRHITAGERTAGTVCRLGIRLNGEWIWKEDGSDETDIEAFKGGISKSLVRAASAWGIGRYLYNLPENFAEVFREEQKGSYRAPWPRKDDKDAPHYFYWLPPALPEWALPKARNEKSPVESRSIRDANDGAPKPLSKPSESKPSGSAPQPDRPADGVQSDRRGDQPSVDAGARDAGSKTESYSFEQAKERIEACKTPKEVSLAWKEITPHLGSFSKEQGAEIVKTRVWQIEAIQRGGKKG